jgi:hypothetical protein
MKDLVRLRGDLPTISRYHANIDPNADHDLAALLVDRALALAGRHAGELAGRWRRLHPDWEHVIDACLAAHMLERDDAQDPAIGAFLGPAIGDGLGRYRIVEALGRGSGGATYEAADRAVGGRVAVKLIVVGDGRAEDTLAEAGWARRVMSEAVARVLDAGAMDPVLARTLCGLDQAVFIVQEYVDALPLHVWKAAHPDASPEAHAGIVEAVRRAVDACHAAGVAHGDLSPANVLVDADGRTRLVDFGRARGTSQASEGRPGESDHDRVEQLAAWLCDDAPAHGRAPRVVRGRLAAVGAIVAAAASTTWFLGGPSLSRGSIATPSPAATAAGPSLEVASTEPSRWLQSMLRDGLPAGGDPSLVQRQADAWSALAQDRGRAKGPVADVELCASVSALACGERARSMLHANRAIMDYGSSESATPTRSADIARLVANLARFFAPGGEDAPPGYAESLELHARRIGAPGLLRLPALEERLAANKSAEEPRRYRSEGGGKVFDAHSGMTIDIPGYEK